MIAPCGAAVLVTSRDMAWGEPTDSLYWGMTPEFEFKVAC